MKKSILLTVFVLAAAIVSAQLTTDERPYGLSVKSSNAGRMPTRTSVERLAAPDMAAVAKEDAENDNVPGPVRYAYAVKTNYDISRSGTWTELEDGGRLWQLKVALPGALSTNAYYDKFWLPEGGKFFVYGEGTGQYIGAVTDRYLEGSRENPAQFATAIIYGDNVTFEYYHPATAGEMPVINISRIDYGYRHVDNPYKEQLRGFGDAASCNININCPEGANWKNEKRAVVLIAIESDYGSYWSSGALVNNTSNNNESYVLTAEHSILEYDANTKSNAPNWMFYWDYEYSECTNSSMEPVHKTTLGAVVKANNSDTDFALLKLMQDPKNLYDFIPYYLGWTRSENVVSSGVCIHHPKGDVKKISLYNHIYSYPNEIEWIRNIGVNIDTSYTPANTHWRVTFQNGRIEGGSSGSPLIDSNHKLIGQLHGGPKMGCNTSYNDRYKNYGKFSVSWTGNGSTDPKRRLRDWLDPIGTNAQNLNGISSCQINSMPVVETSNWCINKSNNQINLAFGNSFYSQVAFDVRIVRVGNSSVTADLGTFYGNTLTAVFFPSSLQTGWYTVEIRPTNCSGSWISTNQMVEINNCFGSYYFSTYPNPVGDVLKLSIRTTDEMRRQQLEALATGKSKAVKERTYTVQLFGTGNLVQQSNASGDEIELSSDVSKLPNGTYFVVVKLDNSDEEPQRTTVIVRK